ncbi:MAG TPA: hypothetical protein VF430_04080 [Verrucomicrobiae bacterium]
MKTKQNLIRLWPMGASRWNRITGGSFSRGFTGCALANHFLVTANGDGGPVSFVGSACTGTNFTCSFQTEAGQSYTVEYNDDLNPTNWEAYYTLPGDDSLIQCLIPMTNAPQRFFRVRQP